MPLLQCMHVLKESTAQGRVDVYVVLAAVCTSMLQIQPIDMQNFSASSEHVVQASFRVLVEVARLISLAWLLHLLRGC